ncbi:PREDICTED: protein THEMIS2 isoform X2 [Calidris pugnax]|uniref:protein THEMIS2 isoform X2 n=1 Tax=Calidris pugnax TaxID=198806 RepID=UPI00071D4D38|nr:PREDICTED: protein THEMIS2 isoform X2 [Calidris pugnax]
MWEKDHQRPTKEYICSLDPTTLPRVLRICAGVYFQGSVYEISGNECCLSTGDLLKVMAVALQKVICEDTMTGQTTELPATFKGLFQPAPAPRPKKTLQTQFLEGGPHQGLTLHQALGQWDRRPQPLLCPAISPHALLLHPVYEVHAIMHLRRDVVKIPSTLEVDVEDVTEKAQHVHFARSLLLSEVLRMEEALPAQAEILEGPTGPAIFESTWVSRLQRGQQLQLHSCSHACWVLASAPSSSRHFLLSSAYQGRFRRRPRQFTGVQELAAGLQPGQRLHVVVTQDCEGRGDNVPPLGVGDRLEAQGLKGKGPNARLLCHHHGGEEEEGEELLLPLDLGGSFVEEMCDSKKYGLAELLERQPLPCEVRVVAADPGLERDVLGTLPALRLEARLDQPVLVGSFCQEPAEAFEIPPRWLDFSVMLSEGPVHPLAPGTRRCRVEELTEAFYYQLLAQLPGALAPPPPRPPKRAQAGTSPGGRHPSSPGSSSVGTRPALSLPPLPALPQPSTSKQYGQRRPRRDTGEAPDTFQALAPPQVSAQRRTAVAGGHGPPAVAAGHAAYGHPLSRAGPRGPGVGMLSRGHVHPRQPGPHRGCTSPSPCPRCRGGPMGWEHPQGLPQALVPRAKGTPMELPHPPVPQTGGSTRRPC